MQCHAHRQFLLHSSDLLALLLKEAGAYSQILQIPIRCFAQPVWYILPGISNVICCVPAVQEGFLVFAVQEALSTCSRVSVMVQSALSAAR